MAQVFVFGDSITYGASDSEGGWVARLRKYLDKQEGYYEVFNLGVPGDTTTDLLTRFQPEIEARLDTEEETIIIFAIGVNDAQLLQNTQTHKVELEMFKDNLQNLVDLARNYSQRIYFVGLTPVDESKTQPIPWNTAKSYDNDSISKYDQALKDFCVTQRLIFIEILDTFKSEKYKDLLEDGLHPNSIGHKIMAELVKNTLKEMLE